MSEPGYPEKLLLSQKHEQRPGEPQRALQAESPREWTDIAIGTPYSYVRNACTGFRTSQSRTPWEKGNPTARDSNPSSPAGNKRTVHSESIKRRRPSRRRNRRGRIPREASRAAPIPPELRAGDRKPDLPAADPRVTLCSDREPPRNINPSRAATAATSFRPLEIAPSHPTKPNAPDSAHAMLHGRSAAWRTIPAADRSSPLSRLSSGRTFVLGQVRRPCPIASRGYRGPEDYGSAMIERLPHRTPRAVAFEEGGIPPPSPLRRLPSNNPVPCRMQQAGDRRNGPNDWMQPDPLFGSAIRASADSSFLLSRIRRC